MLFVFRVDASPNIGHGHWRRCLTLAAELVSVAHVLFLTQTQEGSLLEEARSLGARVSPLPTALKACSLAEADFIIKTLPDEKITCIIDHYQVNPACLAYLSSKDMQVVLIDDLGSIDLTHVDVLLNQNLAAEQLIYNNKTDCRMLLGPQYALLRPQFYQSRSNLKRKFSVTDTNVLVSLGGAGVLEDTQNVFRALELYPQKLNVIYLLGQDAQGQTNWVSSKHQIEIKGLTNDMASLIQSADVSINAGGSTCWELCCLGVPMVLLTRAKNQEAIVEALSLAGCAEKLGYWDSQHTPQALVAVLKNLFNDPEQREVMAKNASALVDGLGAARVAKILAGEKNVHL